MNYLVNEADSFKDALLTQKGSVIGNPSYGTEFYELKHRAFSNSWIIEFRRALKDACSHDDRLSFVSADIDSSNVALGYVSYKVYLTSNRTIEGSIDV